MPLLTQGSPCEEPPLRRQSRSTSAETFVIRVYPTNVGFPESDSAGMQSARCANPMRASIGVFHVQPPWFSPPTAVRNLIPSGAELWDAYSGAYLLGMSLLLVVVVVVFILALVLIGLCCREETKRYARRRTLLEPRPVCRQARHAAGRKQEFPRRFAHLAGPAPVPNAMCPAARTAANPRLSVSTGSKVRRWLWLGWRLVPRFEKRA